MRNKEGKKKKKSLLLLLGLFCYAFLAILFSYITDGAFKFDYNPYVEKREAKAESVSKLVESETDKCLQEINLVTKNESQEPLKITESELNHMLDLVGKFGEIVPHERTANFAFQRMDHQTQTNLINFAQNLEYKEIEKLEDFMVATRDDNLEIHTNDGEIQGWSDDAHYQVSDTIRDIIDRLRDFLVGSCEKPNYEVFKPQAFCGSGSLEGVGDIRIAQIWSLDIKSVGSATGFDNFLLTHNPRGLTAWRNDSNIIMEDYDYFVNMPPSNSSFPLLDSVVLSEGDRFETYEMHYEAAGSLNDIPYDVHPDAKSLCDVLNPGHFNVKASNNLAKELTDYVTPPGSIMSLGDRSFSFNPCNDFFWRTDFDEDESFLLCNEGFFDVLRCIGRNILRFRDTCPDIEGVFVDAALGSGQICNEDDCSSRYWEAARESSSPPTWMGQLHHPDMSKEEIENDYSANHPDETVIFTTPCYLRIDCEICLTKCFWDVSILKHIFEQERVYTHPGFVNAPTIEDYLQAIVDEIKFRARYGSGRY